VPDRGHVSFTTDHERSLYDWILEASPVSRKVAAASARGSWIRRMYDQSRVLTNRYGADRVFDFSLGNPNVEPPPEFKRALRRIMASGVPGLPGYMSNRWP